jgi:alpha-D-xyloside xylohydrolase
MEMPVLAKPNSIIAMGNFENQFEYDYAEGADFMICNLEDGKSASAEIYDVDAKHVLTVTAERSGNTITVTATESGKNFTVSVAGTDKKIAMTGTQAVITL